MIPRQFGAAIVLGSEPSLQWRSIRRRTLVPARIAARVRRGSAEGPQGAESAMLGECRNWQTSMT